MSRNALPKYTRSAPVLKKLSKQSSFTLQDARNLGLSHPVILRLLKTGEVIRLSRGLYAVSGSEIYGAEADYTLAQLKFGKRAVIGGLTALAHYKLIDEVPSKIWVLVPATKRTQDSRYRLLRTQKNLSIGVVQEKNYRIVSLERALIDALMFSSKVGERIAKQAIIRAIRIKITTSEKIFLLAKRMGVLSALEKEWQSILAGLEL